MLKKIALVGFFLLASAFTTAGAVTTHPSAARLPATHPSAPTPKGFCWPSGMGC
jgi:hypothetical protein